jgi:YfiH family protein
VNEILVPRDLNALPGIVAGFTTRTFAPEGTEADDIRLLAAEAAGFAQLAGARQVHGASVAIVTEPGIVLAHDGLVTNRPGLLLTVVAADCALVLLADAGAGVVGACHSGWRGTVAGIVRRTVDAMSGLGAEPARIHAWIAPCISAESFEVGEEVADQFPADAVALRPEWPRPHVDLRRALSSQMEEAGLLSEHVEADDSCPALDTRRFYSFRAEGGTSGRMVGYIGLRSAS